MRNGSANSSGPAQSWARALQNLAGLESGRWRSFPCLIDELADRFEEKVALTSPGDVLTFRGLAMAKNAYAQWALAESSEPGETCCLFMGNCASYLAIWLGIVQVGGRVALINTNLRGDALLHSITSVGARIIIVDSALLPLLVEVKHALPPGISIWLHGDLPAGAAGSRPLRRSDYASEKNGDLQATLADSAESDSTALLIFTSGTTGLPKAARVSHHRLLEWSLWFAGMMNTRQDDRLYDCLPMYHSTGGVAAIGGMLVNGGTVVIRERFSRRRFWTDIVENGCTIFFYIGELCRYLTHAPFDPAEAKHRLRLCCGNGLRAEIWREFQTRFQIPAILEFYASTEGNVSLYNCEGRPGAVGRVPAFLAHRFPTELIRCDPETGEVVRGTDGKCVKCQNGEAGEAIGRISAARQRDVGRFEGYTDEPATEQKILRNVFSVGDAWFRTGDLMHRDAAGFFYFVDRMGDTFRWKGENVSTAQVGEALATYPGITEAIIYGVRVECEEGRAGMAALTTTPVFDLANLPAFLEQRLPPYARPLFLRLCDHIETTSTFKPLKARLIREGYDPTVVSDPLYAFSQETGGFVALQRAEHGRQ